MCAGMTRDRSPGGRGPSQRQLRVGELIRRRLSEVLARGDLHDEALTRMSITVGEVRTSPDLKVATVYVMPLGGSGVEAALEALERHRGELRRLTGRALALKFTPELRFRADETFDRMDATRRMLAEARVRRDVAGAEDDDARAQDEGDAHSPHTRPTDARDGEGEPPAPPLRTG